MSGTTKTVKDLSSEEKRALLSRLLGRRSEARHEPVSFGQRRLWFVQQLDAESRTYHIPFWMQVEGELDTAAFRSAVDAIARRHDVLRTTFARRQGELVQVVEPRPRAGATVVDLLGLEPGRREDEAQRLLTAVPRHRFDLRRGPLWRLALLRTGEREHRLVMGVHHIVFDGWSFGVFVRELAHLYAARLEGRPGELPDMRLQYADYARWQAGRLSGERLDELLSYWRDRLREAPRAELPTDFPRPPVQTFRGARRVETWPPELRDRLREYARQRGGSLFMALVTCLSALIYRYAGQDDLTLGTPVANRPRQELEGLIGFFVNTLVLRVHGEGRPSFGELLDRVRHEVLGAFSHEELPYERLVEELQPDRDLSRNALFQVMVVLMNASPSDLRLPGLRLRPLEVEGRTAKFDLTVELTDGPDGLRVMWNYNTDLFRDSTAARMMTHLRRLAEAALKEPDRPLADLPLLSADERREILAQATGPRPGATFAPLHEQVLAHVDSRPDAVAVEAGGARLTYGELGRRSAALAARLAAAGAGRGSIVAVLAERGVDGVVAALAALRAGAAYMPLDPDYPDERLAFMVRDSAACQVLVQPGLEARLPAAAPTMLLGAETDDGSLALPRVEVGEEDLAYAIYTSGSTGRPKGVALPHRGLANLVAWHLRAYEQGPDDRTTLVAAPAFDAAVWELWPTLAAGGALAVPAREVAASPRRLLHWLNERRVTLCFLPTPLAEAMLRQPDAAPPSLRCLLVGGDKLHRLDFDRLPYRVVNHYGPTESSVVATAGVAGTSPEDPPIGRPIDGVRAYVLDDRQRLVPVGVPGELAVAGRSLARGYLGRPGLTAERFLPDPRSGAGGRLYRTGDLVRRRPDGALDFLGRIDHQVKVRGYRIELGEVEAVLREQPGVAEAVVRVLADGGPQRLVGYVVADGGGEVDAEEVRRAARLRLPDYMVPSAVVSIPEVPLTANGKVDRAALPAPASGDGAAGFVAPRDEMERSLAGIWRQVLRVEEVGVHDNFFDLGGHSLLLAEVQVRLEESLDRSVSMLELFRYTTIASLAERLGDGGERAPRTDLDQLRDRAARQQAALSAGRDAARRVQRRRTENV